MAILEMKITLDLLLFIPLALLAVCGFVSGILLWVQWFEERKMSRSRK